MSSFAHRIHNSSRLMVIHKEAKPCIHLSLEVYCTPLYSCTKYFRLQKYFGHFSFFEIGPKYFLRNLTKLFCAGIQGVLHSSINLEELSKYCLVLSCNTGRFKLSCIQTSVFALSCASCKYRCLHTG